jgi:hypothetical protein
MSQPLPPWPGGPRAGHNPDHGPQPMPLPPKLPTPPPSPPGPPRTWPATSSTSAAARYRALHPATSYPAMPAGWSADPGPITVPVTGCCGALPGDVHDCWTARTYAAFDQPIVLPPHSSLPLHGAR